MQPTPTVNALADPMLRLADAMPQLVWITDAAGAAIYFNTRVHEYAGAGQLEDGTWQWHEMVHPDDIGNTGLVWMHSVATGLPYEVEHRMRRRDGNWHWHLTRALPQHDERGNITHWYGTSTNIHEQKMALDTLSESEQRFRVLTNAIPQIIWIVNAQGQTEYVNDRWEIVTGQSEAEAAGGRRQEMIHPDDLPIVLDQWAIARQQGTGAEWEYRLRNKATARYTWFKGTVHPLRDSAGRITNWIGAATDIQALKDNAGYLEEQVAERTRDLRDLNVTLHEQAGALQRSNDDLQQFAYVASHDLKEPLRKIRTFASRVLGEYSGNLPENGRTYLERIDAAAGRMAQLIDGVLRYSVVDEVEEQHRTPVALDSVLSDVVADLEVVIQHLDARVSYGELPTVSGMKVLLHQLFSNLTNNALKFVRDGVPPVVEVTSRIAEASELALHGLPASGSFAAISVRDNGIGFEPEYAENVFQTFSRLHPKDRFEGTGLGLALCRKIVLRHGGAIAAAGKPGEGAVFTVYLPLA